MRKIKPETNKEMATEMPKRHYPSFYISLDHLPEAEKWEPGKTYQLGLEVKMTGINIREDEKDKKGDANFDIIGIEVQKRSKEKKEKVNRY